MKNELFRGVSKELFDRDGKILKPRISGHFDSIIHLDEGHCLDEGFTLDSSADNSVVKHQKDSGKYPTSSISTTPLYERAKYYATHDGKKNGFIFVIDRKSLEKYSVNEFVVSDFATPPSIPEDQEVILYCDNGKELPNGAICAVEVFKNIYTPPDD